MQDGWKAVWSIPYVSVAFFPSLKQNYIAYRSSKVSSRPDCIFEIYQLWQSGSSRVYYNCCCKGAFEHEIIKIGQSSHKTYSNNILNFQESTTILNACTKKSGNLLNAPRIFYKTLLKFLLHAYTKIITHSHTRIFDKVYLNIRYVFYSVRVDISMYICLYCFVLNIFVCVVYIACYITTAPPQIS